MGEESSAGGGHEIFWAGRTAMLLKGCSTRMKARLADMTFDGIR
jgi:hypothetical protein